MRVSTYRLIVVGTLLSSSLVGLHVPALHEMLEHGSRVRADVIAATLLLAVITVAGAWTLLRAAGPLRGRD